MAELVVAFDLPTGKEALALASRLPGLRWAKIGPVLYVREGPALVREFTARGIRVFLDLKWHDIPNTVAGAVEGARELGASLATVHCLGGRAMLSAAQKAAGEAGSAGALSLVGVTVLTSHDAGGFEGVVGRGVPDLGSEVVRLARSARDAGLRGVVASGHEIGVLREALGAEPWLVVPGIRAPGAGAAVDDQARTVTPGEAVRRGATHLVVGRPITGSPDPQSAFRGMLEAMTT
ncbi:MAG TPA: orotidine-5'-phosphate decarboxylase [Gemmatimonadales bacterium]|nr:orotidine-5'-phosphate decarboxylase [Gemmatimonadales bacterium]